MRIITSLLLSIIFLCTVCTSYAQLSPEAAVEAIGRGINLGNTLDAPYEGDWALKAEEYYFDAYKDAGFKSVRIPITWANHVAEKAPYKVDPAFMDRVEQIVDWGLERDFIIIMNCHHEKWLKENYNAESVARFEAIWVQISDRFYQKSERLLFETLNEPHGMTIAEAADANQRALDIIREKNPTRNVIIAGNEWSAIKDLLTMPIPSDDDYLIANYHTYDPWDFSFAEKDLTWGTQAEKNYISNEFEKAKNWSATNGMPVIMNEFGAVHDTDFNSRMRHYAHYVEESLSRGISFMAWDDGGWYEIYQRDDKKWHETKDILIHNTKQTPTNLLLTMNADSTVSIQWENRNTASTPLKIERKVVGSDQFAVIDEVEPTENSYKDVSVTPGDKYQYRISQMQGDQVIISYPQQIDLVNYESLPFGGTPAVIPGVLEAENYNLGIAGIAYNDQEEENQGGAYREDGVDIEAREDGGFHVGYVEPNEWMEYTVIVLESGTYAITSLVATEQAGGRFKVSTSKSSVIASVDVPSTNSWETTTEVESEIFLEAGEQKLRITIDKKPPFNLDKLIFTKKEELPPTSIEDDREKGQALIYPNPFHHSFTLRFLQDVRFGDQVYIYDLVGNKVSSIKIEEAQSIIDLSAFSEGIYFVKYQSNGKEYIRKVIKQ
ncbi:cellulase family glycosylhydrolase [Flammeovirga sp. EKP202]|uniref:cellulase family glycosylhydrolase n=1 Tax=Flammeovirga sp. EKP202 TaxID=2770592 RepID=UPI00165F4323|nr:cellulase family glycosylhydrolase [Flammeovirga sp. EKP202]MBD0400990.1 cellulase family glycosylhydrolase [Flammeovirga sp. EKP202]